MEHLWSSFVPQPPCKQDCVPTTGKELRLREGKVLSSHKAGGACLVPLLSAGGAGWEEIEAGREDRKPTASYL